MEIEIWKDIIGYEGRYKISNHGNVKSLSRPHSKFKSKGDFIRKLVLDKSGYLTVSLQTNGITKNYRVHQLVAKYFISNYGAERFICHKDDNKTNNRSDNLYIGDRASNTADHYRFGRTKVSIEQLKEIKYSNDSNKHLAVKFSLSRSFISRVKSGVSGKVLSLIGE